MVDVICPFYPESNSREERWGTVHIHRFHYLPRQLQTLIGNGGIPTNFRKSFFAKIQLPLLFLAMFFKARSYAGGSDIIHCQWSLTALVGVLIKVMYRKPLVLTERGSSLNAAVKYKITRKVLVWLLSKCDYITANNFNQIDTIRMLGFTEYIKAVPNGVDIEIFKPRDKLTARKVAGLESGKRIILYVGWIVEAKGIGYLLQAAVDLINTFSDLLFVFVGGGLGLEGYKRDVYRLGLQGHVLFTGPRMPDEIPYYMNAADIFVLPSLSEGRPNVVPEAMACGLPVIATKVNGLPEFINNGTDGILIEPESISSLIDSVTELLNDKTMYTQIQGNARNSVKHLSWETTARNFVEIYDILDCESH